MSLVEEYAKEDNILLLEIENLKKRINELELKFDNEIEKRRGPKVKSKKEKFMVDTSVLQDFIVIYDEKPNDKYNIILLFDTEEQKTAPIIELTENQLQCFLQKIIEGEINEKVVLNDYILTNKIAVKDGECWNLNKV